MLTDSLWRLASLLLLCAIGLAADDKGKAGTPALPVADALKQFVLPKGFTILPVASEPEVVQPIASCTDERGRLWVVENTNYPNCPGSPKDRILVFEDVDGDGKDWKKTVFFDKLTFASGIQVGFGGVWVGAPPNLLFFPDKDGNAVPDGPAQTVLDGWGNQDTHETLNGFIWGPDGWLYGTQGVFTNSKVGAPGTAADQRQPCNACVWRLHPVTRTFELFSEGGSNQWGVDWNDHGQAFFTACVIPHMFHAVQGGRYHRQGGQFNNKHTYDFIKTIVSDKHAAAAFAGSLLYQGGLFPAEYRNTILFHNIHSSHLHCEDLVRQGSGFKAKNHGDGNLMHSPDNWYRALIPHSGPDGSVFLTDWYDKVHCHQQRGETEREHGRLYKLTYDGVKPAANLDLAKWSDEQLVAAQLDANDWYVRSARRLLMERGPKPAVHAALAKILAEHPDETRKLRALWALHCAKGLSEEIALKQLASPLEYVRAWTIQLMCEDGKPSAAALTQFAALAKADPSPVVRLYLASAMGRVAIASRWPVVEALAAKAEDAADRNIPCVLWYAIEPLVPSDPAKALALAGTTQIPKIREFITRRSAAK